MSFSLPPLKDLYIDKDLMIASARESAPYATPDLAKETLVALCMTSLTHQIEEIVQNLADPTIELADMMGDDPRPALIEQFGTVGNLGQDHGTAVQHIAFTLATGYQPAKDQGGRWLAQFGFVASDWNALAVQDKLAAGVMPPIPDILKRTAPPAAPVASITAPPSVPAPPPRLAAALNEAVPSAGISELPAFEQRLPDDNNAPQEPAQTLQPVAGPPGAEPDKKALSDAYAKLLPMTAEATADLSARLSVSKGTLSNWMSGRAAPKCSVAQAKILLADIDRRIASLTDAAQIFAAVR